MPVFVALFIPIYLVTALVLLVRRGEDRFRWRDAASPAASLTGATVVVLYIGTQIVDTYFGKDGIDGNFAPYLTVGLTLALVLLVFFVVAKVKSVPIPPWDRADPAIAPLVGTTWAVVSFGNAGRPPRTYRPGDKVTLSFEEGGVIAGQAPCNRYGGLDSYYRGRPGGGLMLHYGDRTNLVCLGWPGADDQQFLGALELTTDYRLADGRLTLLGRASKPLVTLSRV